MRRARSSRASMAALAVFAAVALAGCSVPGVAFPDAVKQQRYMQDLADQQFDLLSEHIGQAPEVKGAEYLHVVFGDEETHVNNAVILFGDPTSAFSQDKGSSDGNTIDVYHVGGTGVDYLLLGGDLKELAPTEWVAVPTRYVQEDDAADTLGPACSYPGISTACTIYAAVQATLDSDVGSRVNVVVSTRSDGSSQITTSASLQSVVDLGPSFGLPEDAATAFTAEELETLLPVTIFQNADGGLQKAELSGKVDGSKPLQLQTGFEVTGPATLEDLPTRPSAFDVTVIPQADEQAFWDKIQELRT